MPYIKKTKDRSREQAIQDPKDAGELNLSITTECLKYLKERGEKYQYYTHVINALSYDSTGGSYNHLKIINGKLLKEKINYIVNHYRDTFPGGGDREEEIFGTTKAAVMEFYWRMARLYENRKIIENGDVFPYPEAIMAIMRENLRLRDEMKTFRDHFQKYVTMTRKETK